MVPASAQHHGAAHDSRYAIHPVPACPHGRRAPYAPMDGGLRTKNRVCFNGNHLQIIMLHIEYNSEILSDIDLWPWERRLKNEKSQNSRNFV
jgi:hypothetical protein